jgi:hypothetical protein
MAGLWTVVQLVFAAIVIVEWIGIYRFQPWAYRTGIPVIHETRALARPPRSAGSEFESESARFKIVGLQLCLFHYPAFMRVERPGSSRPTGPLLYPPFIKGTIAWNDGQVAMQGRVSWLVTLILIQAAAALAFSVVNAPADPVPVIVSVVVWTLIGGILFLLLWRRIRGASRILNEFEASKAPG